MTHRPWGYYEVLEDGPNYKVKKLVVYPAQKTSLQMHFHRVEHWVVVLGRATVSLGDTHTKSIVNMYRNSGNRTYIKADQVHRLANDTTSDLVVIEVQIGVCDEDDIKRIEDLYGRA